MRPSISLDWHELTVTLGPLELTIERPRYWPRPRLTIDDENRPPRWVEISFGTGNGDPHVALLLERRR